MTIQRHQSNFLVSCDDCSYEEDMSEDHFNEVIEAMKDAGWRITKNNGEWHHQCPSCSEDEVKDLR